MVGRPPVPVLCRNKEHPCIDAWIIALQWGEWIDKEENHRKWDKVVICLVTNSEKIFAKVFCKPLPLSPPLFLCCYCCSPFFLQAQKATEEIDPRLLIVIDDSRCLFNGYD